MRFRLRAAWDECPGKERWQRDCTHQWNSSRWMILSQPWRIWSWEILGGKFGGKFIHLPSSRSDKGREFVSVCYFSYDIIAVHTYNHLLNILLTWSNLWIQNSQNMIAQISCSKCFGIFQSSLSNLICTHWLCVIFNTASIWEDCAYWRNIINKNIFKHGTWFCLKKLWNFVNLVKLLRLCYTKFATNATGVTSTPNL